MKLRDHHTNPALKKTVGLLKLSHEGKHYNSRDDQHDYGNVLKRQYVGKFSWHGLFQELIKDGGGNKKHCSCYLSGIHDVSKINNVHNYQDLSLYLRAMYNDRLPNVIFDVKFGRGPSTYEIFMKPIPSLNSLKIL